MTESSPSAWSIDLVHRPEWMQVPVGPTEVNRHRIALPGRPVIDSAHYLGPQRAMDGSPAEAEAVQRRRFRVPRPRARLRVVADRSRCKRVARIRTKMAAAVELTALIGAGQVVIAVGLAATVDQFEEDALVSITQRRESIARPAGLVVADETNSAQPGTSDPAPADQ